MLFRSQVRRDGGQVLHDDQARVAGEELGLTAHLDDPQIVGARRGRPRGGVLDDDALLGAQAEALDRRRVGRGGGLARQPVVAGDQLDEHIAQRVGDRLDNGARGLGDNDLGQPDLVERGGDAPGAGKDRGIGADGRLDPGRYLGEDLGGGSSLHDVHKISALIIK